MSMFLPEGTYPGQTQQGVASVSPANPETTKEDIALMQRVLAAASRNPNMIPADFMAYLIDYLQTQRLSLPIGQVFGYDNSVNSIVASALAATFKAHIASSEPEVSITSTSYATFTGAPAITGLDDGQYLVLWGASAKGDDSAGGSDLNFTYIANGSATGNICEQQDQDWYSSVARGDTVTLGAGAGANTLAMVALTTTAGHTSKIRNAWIACLKYAN
jgi:hypothetical protein